MLLALDVGNTQIYGGVFDGGELKLRFRRTSKGQAASDELGVFFKAALRENGVDPASIDEVAICSVVPELIYPLVQASAKYFKSEPFVLQAGIKTGLNLKYKNPQEIGADRIANAIAATSLFPGRDLVIVDLGTATTFCAVSAAKEYLGGVIMPGLRLSMESLSSGTAKLPRVEIARPPALVGKTTVEGIQSGLYHGNLFAIKGIVAGIKEQNFGGNALAVGTGGFSKLFEDAGVFDKIVPDLVLHGIAEAVKLSKEKKTK